MVVGVVLLLLPRAAALRGDGGKSRHNHDAANQER
jgi:hypothetical protein